MEPNRIEPNRIEPNRIEIHASNHSEFPCPTSIGVFPCPTSIGVPLSDFHQSLLRDNERPDSNYYFIRYCMANFLICANNYCGCRSCTYYYFYFYYFDFLLLFFFKKILHFLRTNNEGTFNNEKNHTLHTYLHTYINI